MIITRAPFRVSFCGGGSDLPSFYERYGGCVLSTTIRKYMYVTMHNYFYPNRISLKYSKTEDVDKYEDIKHKYFRQCLADMGINGVEITSMADIPAGTGLGSSSSFTVALLQLLHTYKGEYIDKYKLLVRWRLKNLVSQSVSRISLQRLLAGLDSMSFYQQGL